MTTISMIGRLAAPHASRGDAGWLAALAWPIEQLDHALETLAHKRGLAPRSSALPTAPADLALAGEQELERWVEASTDCLGLEAERADLTFAQFVLLTPFPGTVDFDKWAADANRRGTTVDGVPITQHWLIPEAQRPRLYAAHPTMSLEEIRVGTQRAWDRFYSWRQVWVRSRVVESIRARIAFVLISKLYRQMYANTGIATDSARVQRSARWARWIGHACRRLFLGKPMPDLAFPGEPLEPAINEG